MIEYRTSARVTEGGVAVERQMLVRRHDLSVAEDVWETIDRYNAADVKRQPRRREKWVTDFVTACNGAPDPEPLPCPDTAFGCMASPEAFARAGTVIDASTVGQPCPTLMSKRDVTAADNTPRNDFERTQVNAHPHIQRCTGPCERLTLTTCADCRACFTCCECGNPSNARIVTPARVG